MQVGSNATTKSTKGKRGTAKGERRRAQGKRRRLQRIRRRAQGKKELRNREEAEQHKARDHLFN